MKNRVLVAEDAAASRKLLERFLEHWGYEVVSAEDGEKAWETLTSPGSPRLLLIDWEMPGLCGPDICRKIRDSEEMNSCYVILITARDGKENVLEGLEAGADDYIVKPFDKDELHARVKVGERVLGLQKSLERRISELQDAMSHIKTLQGLLPICMHCHKIRTDEHSWERIEKYIRDHTDAEFSHGVCPECHKKHYPEYAAELLAEAEDT